MKKRIVKEKYSRPTKNNTPANHVLHIFNETRVRIPRTALQAIYNDLLKKRCSLNLICVGDAFSRKLHKEHHGKDTPANILTFPPNTDNVAEIYLNTAMAERTARQNDTTTRKQVLFLYIHGILHVLGHRHGAQMELLEDQYITLYT